VLAPASAREGAGRGNILAAENERLRVALAMG